MNQSAAHPARSPAPLLPRPHRFVRRLASLYAAAAAIVLLLLSARILPASIAPRTRGLVDEAIAGGLGGMVLSALLLALTGLAATLALTAARHRLWRFEPGFAARVGQALIVPLGAILLCAAAALLWPVGAPTMLPANANTVSAFVFALAFVSLVAERSMHAFPAAQLAEAPALRRLLLLSTLLLVAAGCVELGRAAELSWMRWPALLLICLPCLVAVELAVRALARMFLPAPSAMNAQAVTESVIATLLTGGPRAPGELLRTHFGLDFARS